MTKNKYKKTIYLYGDDIGRVDYVDHVGSDLTVVNSARASFGVEREDLDDRDKKLIKYLVEHKHTSTLEHCFISFRMVVPLFIRSQHHRHRTWSYNEISRRYTEVDLKFYEPAQFRTQHKSNRQASNDELINPILSSSDRADLAVKQHHFDSLRLFEELINLGVCREQARGVLPQNLYSTYWASTNLNNLMKFIGLRLHDGAQWEIQQVAKACLEIAEDLYPVTVAAYKEVLNENR